MNYKMIASDLDGTLLYDVFSVSPENFEAIKKYSEMGGLLVPASGRCLYEVIPELRECPHIKYIISSNGAMITNTESGERDRVSIEKELLNALLDTIQEYETHITLHYDGYGYVDEATDDWDIASGYNMNIYYFEHYRKWCKKPKGLNAFIRSIDSAEMLSVFFRYQEQLEECQKRLLKLGGLAVTSSAPYNLEIISSDATKGSALERLAQRLGIEKSEIIAVGDSDNDTSLLGAAGLPLAVSNARESLKACAKKVICHHREHIVKYILENIIE